MEINKIVKLTLRNQENATKRQTDPPTHRNPALVPALIGKVHSTLSSKDE
jgi:hypothetical protein